mmetsp:Transcript_57644/g.114426  ORF Transcript_57644/g.114426 Transcript_57644/m.114426 type:complete len:214 (-) Transcript_57644:12-653(-)
MSTSSLAEAESTLRKLNVWVDELAGRDLDGGLTTASVCSPDRELLRDRSAESMRTIETEKLLLGCTTIAAAGAAALGLEAVVAVTRAVIAAAGATGTPSSEVWRPFVTMKIDPPPLQVWRTAVPTSAQQGLLVRFQRIRMTVRMVTTIITEMVMPERSRVRVRVTVEVEVDVEVEAEAEDEVEDGGAGEAKDEGVGVGVDVGVWVRVWVRVRV